MSTVLWKNIDTKVYQQNISNTMCMHYFMYYLFLIEQLILLLIITEHSWGALGRSWGALGALLRRSWALLGRSWDALGALLGHSWALLGRSWASLGHNLGKDQFRCVFLPPTWPSKRSQVGAKILPKSTYEKRYDFRDDFSSFLKGLPSILNSRNRFLFDVKWRHP